MWSPEPKIMNPKPQIPPYDNLKLQILHLTPWILIRNPKPYISGGFTLPAKVCIERRA